MNPGVLASADPMYAVEGRISFWVLQLTKDQIEELKSEQMQGIRAVETNAPIEPSGVLLSPNIIGTDRSLKVSRAERKSCYSKRDTVIKQQREGVEDVPRLRFVQTNKKRHAQSIRLFLTRWCRDHSLYDWYRSQ